MHDPRHREAECLRRFEIDDECELRGLLHRKLGGLLALEDAIDIEGRLAELVVYVRSIREEAARIDILAALKGRRQSRRLRKLRDPPAVFDETTTPSTLSALSCANAWSNSSDV